MKNYLFYQLIMTVRGRHDDKGRLAEEISDNLAFLRHDDNFNILSDYIETHDDSTLSMSVFDGLYEEYTEWLEF